jgi:hypothetical protein
MRVDLPLEFPHQGLRLPQMPLERRLAPERTGPGIRTDPHPVLGQPIQIDDPSLGQCRQMLAQQPVEQISTPHPEVAQRVMVHRHAATEPAIGIVALA